MEFHLHISCPPLWHGAFTFTYDGRFHETLMMSKNYGKTSLGNPIMYTYLAVVNSCSSSGF